MIRRYIPLIKEILWYVARKQIVRYSSNSRIIADPAKWAAIRTKVLQRDGYTCRACGKHEQSELLDAHHVKPYWKGGKDEDANLITVCNDCHIKHHSNDAETKAEAQRRRSEAQKAPHLVMCRCGCHGLFIGKNR